MIGRLTKDLLDSDFAEIIAFGAGADIRVRDVLQAANSGDISYLRSLKMKWDRMDAFRVSRLRERYSSKEVRQAYRHLTDLLDYLGEARKAMRKNGMKKVYGDSDRMNRQSQEAREMYRLLRVLEAQGIEVPDTLNNHRDLVMFSIGQIGGEATADAMEESSFSKEVSSQVRRAFRQVAATNLGAFINSMGYGRGYGMMDSQSVLDNADDVLSNFEAILSAASAADLPRHLRSIYNSYKPSEIEYAYEQFDDMLSEIYDYEYDEKSRFAKRDMEDKMGSTNMKEEATLDMIGKSRFEKVATVQFSAFDRNGQLKVREKSFPTGRAMQRYLSKLEESGNLYEVLRYEDSEDDDYGVPASRKSRLTKATWDDIPDEIERLTDLISSSLEYFDDLRSEGFGTRLYGRELSADEIDSSLPSRQQLDGWSYRLFNLSNDLKVASEELYKSARFSKSRFMKEDDEEFEELDDVDMIDMDDFDSEEDDEEPLALDDSTRAVLIALGFEDVLDEGDAALEENAEEILDALADAADDPEKELSEEDAAAIDPMDITMAFENFEALYGLPEAEDMADTIDEIDDMVDDLDEFVDEADDEIDGDEEDTEKADVSRERLVELLELSEDADADAALDAAYRLMDEARDSFEDYWAEYEDLSDEDQDDLNMEWTESISQSAYEFINEFNSDLADALYQGDVERMYAMNSMDMSMLENDVEAIIIDAFEVVEKSKDVISKRSLMLMKRLGFNGQADSLAKSKALNQASYDALMVGLKSLASPNPPFYVPQVAVHKSIKEVDAAQHAWFERQPGAVEKANFLFGDVTKATSLDNFENALRMGEWK